MQPFAETILRTVVLFVAAIVGSRFVGQPFKVVSGVAIGAMAAWAASNPTVSVYHGILALLVWSVLNLLVSLAALKLTPVRDFVFGKATPLVENGKVLDKNLQKSRMSISDMMGLLRQKNAFKLADVEFATLESDGNVSVLLKSDSQPMTPRTQNLSVENEAAPGIVIVDGEVLPDVLANLGYDRAWLLQQIRAQGAENWSDVFVAQVDAKGNVYVDLYDDLIEQKTSRGNPKPQVLATLKKAQADLELYALQTQNPEAKANYERHAGMVQDMIAKLTPYLRK
jgi:uncharacterized membrane protein YcaP (DUF421 family)